MKKYSVEEITEEFKRETSNEKYRFYPTEGEKFLLNKIVELTNRIQELESKGIKDRCLTCYERSATNSHECILICSENKDPKRNNTTKSLYENKGK